MARLAAVLDGEYETVEDAARAALEEAFAIYEAKAKFTIVGQLYYSPKGGWSSPEEAAATKVALGRYGTETAALRDAESFAISSTTHEQFRAWVLPVFHGTPASYFSGRKSALKAIEAASDGPSQADLLVASLRQAGWVTDEELADRASERCAECGNPLPEHDALAGGTEIAPRNAA